MPIKVCTNPNCEEIAHNIEKEEKRCRNCGFLMVEINQETYLKKYSKWFWQYDYKTGNLHTSRQILKEFFGDKIKKT